MPYSIDHYYYRNYYSQNYKKYMYIPISTIAYIVMQLT